MERNQKLTEIPIFVLKFYRDIYDQVKREFGLYGEDGKPKSYKSLKRKYIYEAHECIELL